MKAVTSPAACRRAALPVRKIRASRPSARPVIVRAGLGDFFSDVGRNFLSILSPAKDEGVDWEGTTHNYQGKGSRDRRNKPFGDGFTGSVRAKVEEVKQDVAEVTEDVQQSIPMTTQAKLESDNVGEKAEGFFEYIGKAAQRLVGHNFKGDETEPEDWKNQEGSGWKGDIRKREKKDRGFHSKVL